jgi:hypothetical protein
MPTITVNLHGLTLAFTSADAALTQRFITVYGHLPPGAGPDRILIDWRLHPEPLAPPPPSGVAEISAGEQVSYYGNASSTVVIRLPKYGLITVDLALGQITGQVTPNCLAVYGAFEDVLMISLAPLYRRRGWFPLHAFAALAPTGQAALITGAMGAGKTTTGLALLAAGWKLLSNDSPLLRAGASGVEVLACPGQLSAFDDSLGRFEGLKKFIPAGKNSGDKRVFQAEAAFVEPWAEAGVAGGVFFPQVVPGLARSELHSIPASDAILHLLPQAIEGWDKAVIGPHLRLLGQLVEQAPCYRLRLSPQVDELPPLLAGGMAGG